MSTGVVAPTVIHEGRATLTVLIEESVITVAR